MRKFWLLSVLFFMATLVISAQSPNKSMEKTINVNAIADREVNPDELVLYVNVRAKENDFDSALDKMNASLADAKRILSNNKVPSDQIKTTNYSINQNFRYNKGKQDPDGFVAYTSLEVKMPKDTKMLSTLIQSFGTENPDLSLNFSFTISDALKEKILEELLTEAAQRARSKATTIAKALGKEIDDIKQVSFSENGFSPYIPQFRAMAAMEAGMASDMAMESPIENVKEIKVNISMNTVWVMK